MRESDQQLGKPMRLYQDTQANIVALGLGAGDEGCIAYANDVDDFGTFDGANWTWMAAPPAVAGYALVSDGVDTWVSDQTPAWTGEHSFAAGIAFTGASDANEITIPDNTAIALEILDAGGLEYVRIVSTDANPYFLIDSAATGFLVGVGVAVPVAHLDVYDATVSTTATYYGGRFDHTKTAGVTDTADRLYGLIGNIEFNQGGGIIGHVDGLSGQATMTAGEIGQGGTLRHLRGLICVATHAGGTTWGDVVGSYLVVDVDAGTIGRDIFGSNIVVDIEAAVTSIGQNVYGLRIWMDVDQDPVGTVYGVHLTEGSNQDFGFYQSGSAINYFGGSVGIGTTTPVALEHLYSTANAARGIIIDAKGTGTSQSAFLNFLTVGTGAVDVGNAASQGWHFTARGNAYATAAQQNDLMIYFWDGAAWNLMQYWDHLGNVGIGVLYPAAKCHIDQASTTATIPVLILDQADTSEGFINFVGSDRGVILSSVDSLRSVRVEWNGTVYRLALYIDA